MKVFHCSFFATALVIINNLITCKHQFFGMGNDITRVNLGKIDGLDLRVSVRVCSVRDTLEDYQDMLAG
jgi:hypothetical protein